MFICYFFKRNYLSNCVTASSKVFMHESILYMLHQCTGQVKIQKSVLT